MDNTYDIALDMLESAEAKVQSVIGEVVTEDDMAAIEMLRHAYGEVQSAEWARMQESR